MYIRNKTLITVIITTYNRYKKAQKAIQSALYQTYKPLEIILIEDGSSSGIENWVKDNFKDIIYVKHHTNKGLAAARNTGLKLAKGDYIAYLDDDDIWKPNRLEKQVKILNELNEKESSMLGAVYCGAEINRYNGRVIRFSFPVNSGRLKESIIKNGLKTIPSSCLFKKSALKIIGGFDENLMSSIDHDCWVSLAKFGFSAFYTSEVLVVNFIGTGNKTMTTDLNDRINGIKLFLSKWKTVFMEWMGNSKGLFFIAKYLSKNLTKLAVNKIFELNFHDFFIVIFNIFKFDYKLFAETSPHNKILIFGLIAFSFIKVFFIESLRNFYLYIEYKIKLKSGR